ncbi:hypothetical protein ACIRD2_02070 [Streptomyces sp. NPDC093595]|uniref:hypothetical protein n=1 Tax=Streptomyces sp. NPDC093595 TaxID=3366045 RepID=UPI00382613DF
MSSGAQPFDVASVLREVTMVRLEGAVRIRGLDLPPPRRAAVAVPRPGTDDYGAAPPDVARTAARARAPMTLERQDFTPPLRPVRGRAPAERITGALPGTGRAASGRGGGPTWR